jgi:hypothetical protein
MMAKEFLEDLTCPMNSHEKQKIKLLVLVANKDKRKDKIDD